MAAYKYVKNKKDSDNTASFKHEGVTYFPGDSVELNKSEFEKLSSRFVLEPVVKTKVEKNVGPTAGRSFPLSSRIKSDFDEGGE